jgi:virginiamycin B lyase
MGLSVQMGRLSLLLVLLSLSVPGAARATSAGQAPPVVGQVTEYQLGAGTRPTALAAGPDGNLWFAGIRYVSGGFADVLGRVTPQGQVSEFELGTHSANVGLSDIAAGPDGNLWFTEGGRTKVGRITTAGQITEYGLPQGAGSATAIAAGADGNLWFTESGVSRIGRITPSGEVTEFPLAGGRAFWGGGIAAGSDGALWVTLPGAGAIARIGVDGSETDFRLSEEPPADYPNDIVADPDGGLWFGKAQAPVLGRINAAGLLTQLTLVKGPTISALAAGPFGDVWYSNGGGRIGWLIPGVAQGTTGCINECSSPVTDLAEGPDGKLWFVAGVDGLSPYNTPGTIGTYAPPPLEVRVVGAGRVQGRRVQIPVRCPWTPAGRRCEGRLRLFEEKRKLVQSRLGLRLGAKQTVALRLPRPAAAALATRGQLPVRVTTTVAGGRRDTTRIVLHRP